MTFRGTLQERLERDTIPEPMSGCHLFYGTPDHSGYGKFKWRGVQIFAHRTAWELTFGPIPPGLCVCHRCDNPPCVNPDHLFLGTRYDNNKDRSRKGRTSRMPGSKHWHAKITEEQARQIQQSTLPGPELMSLYKLSKAQISAIRTGRSWKHLTTQEN